LHHAIMNAYEDILPTDTFPLYVLFIEIDPSKIDINVHPTKTEIKYEDERAIYAILRSAVKRSLGRYNIAPSLDFDQETSFDNFITPKPLEEIQAPTISFNPNFNPFDTDETSSDSPSASRTGRYSATLERKTDVPQNWDTLYQITEQEEVEQLYLKPNENDEDQFGDFTESRKQFFQIHNRYIVSQIHSGFILIDQQAAHERILFEQYLD